MKYFTRKIGYSMHLCQFMCQETEDFPEGVWVRLLWPDGVEYTESKLQSRIYGYESNPALQKKLDIGWGFTYIFT
jgi:hypothetical protein